MGKNKTKRTKRNHLRAHKRNLKAIEAISKYVALVGSIVNVAKIASQASKCLKCKHNFEEIEFKSSGFVIPAQNSGEKVLSMKDQIRLKDGLKGERE